ncbi:MAG TPA: hypothetical protein DDZ67_13175 [Xanthomonadaceae bacterium]|nr:hypothetical protein [Xanthomonadaceae bacterium]
MVAVLALSACAGSERLMDAGVRPTDHADCLVGNDPHDSERSSGVRSLRDRRCDPDDRLNWTVGQSRKDSMDVDFRNEHE